MYKRKENIWTSFDKGFTLIDFKCVIKFKDLLSLNSIEPSALRVLGLHLKEDLKIDPDMEPINQRITNLLLFLGYIPLIGFIVAVIRVKAMQEGNYETSLKRAVYARATLEALGIGVLLLLVDAVVTIYRFVTFPNETVAPFDNGNANEPIEERREIEEVPNQPLDEVARRNIMDADMHTIETLGPKVMQQYNIRRSIRLEAMTTMRNLGPLLEAPIKIFPDYQRTCIFCC